MKSGKHSALLRRENPNLSETVFRMDAVLRQEDSYLEKVW